PLQEKWELLNRSSLESQKLGLMEEVPGLKLKLGNMEEKHINSAERQHKAEVKMKFKIKHIELYKSKYLDLQLTVLFLFVCFVLFCFVGYQYIFFQDCRIEELTLLLSQFRKMNDIMTVVQGKYIYLLAVCVCPTGITEKIKDTTNSDLSSVSSGVDSGQQSPVLQENVKNSSIRKLWGKMKRPGVLSDDIEPIQFKRGGFRATAGPRLIRAPDSGRPSRAHTSFSKWTTEQVCGWLEDIGLGQYVSLARQWVDSGQTLLSATPRDLEKEICIKHPLHRKKLQLALRAFSNKTMEKSSELDHIWVTHWLDDIGLPQYKDQFYESKVDGGMLQYLTVNDLLFLKVTSQLHHLSIKCAIHVLHVHKFNPNCLRRRPGGENKTSPSEVVQWSNHRVMEWLRSVDLAEYAPNLRGSGVHGGLIILEPRFHSETLAMLLNIPPQKTLLRRHLTTNFNTLVGPQAQQEKQEFANASGHPPLTTTAKVRPKKLGFTHFRQLRKLRMDESADYICPMDTWNPPAMSGTPKRRYGSFRGILARDSDRLEQVGNAI
uniref:PPFIA binding protein 2a n=1 Tax=Cyprinus carpio TaxID=7962 RepID=A0A8C2IWU1_CYPCA